MSLPVETSSAGRRNWSAFAGWVWIALLVVCYVLAVYKSNPRDALDLGEAAFTSVMVLGIACVGLIPATAVYWFAKGVSGLYLKRSNKGAPWIRLSVLVLCLGGIAKWPKTITPYNPITPASEPVYLALAAAAREHLSGPNSGTWLSLDPSSREYLESKVPGAVRKQLEQMVPVYWPRFLLHIWIDGDCVVLDRGSGMLGRVGVRIYDRGSVVLYSADELRKNSYLPDQKRITDRVWFFRSD
ncbi:MAG: hypothetical protein RIQ79_358 [Verrucomicrobiota bacterium]|jgi:hypothetical protein